MALTDIGNDTDGRLGYIGKFLNLSQPAHSQFHDAGTVFLRQLQQGTRQADFIVKILLGLQYIVLLFEDRGNKRTCRRLPGRAGDGHDGNGKTAAMEKRQILICLTCILDDKNRIIAVRVKARRIFHDNAGSAVTDGLLNEIMAVELFPFQRRKKIVFTDSTRICRDIPIKHIPATLLQNPRPRCENDFRIRKHGHLYLSFNRCTASRATSLSSKCIVPSFKIWYVSCPLPAMRTISPLSAISTARIMAARLSVMTS